MHIGELVAFVPISETMQSTTSIKTAAHPGDAHLENGREEPPSCLKLVIADEEALVTIDDVKD